MRSVRRIGMSLALLAIAAPAMAAERWRTVWLASPIGWEPTSKKAYPRPLADQTVAQTIRVLGAGGRIRVRLTNELGTNPLAIGAGSVAIGEGAPVPLRFGGVQGATIPAGAPLYSDPVTLPVRAGTMLTVRIHYPASATPAAHAQMVRLTAGDTTGRAGAGEEFRTAGLVSAVEVAAAAAPARVLVTFGDSITEGAGASEAGRTSWPAQVAALLDAQPATRCWTVVNAGISGNRLLHDGRGPNALARFDRDVASVPGATHLVLLEGINDIGAGKGKPAEAVEAADIIAAYRQIIDRAHAAALKVIGGTLLPYVGAAYQDAAGEAKRVAVNRWIRTGGGFDAVIDFDAATRAPEAPDRLIAGFEIGDHLHPNDTGYAAMARAARPVIAAQGCPRQ